MSIAEWAWVCEEHPETEWPHDDCDGAGMPRRRSAATWLVEMTREDREHPTIVHVPFEEAETEAAAREIATAHMPSYAIQSTTAVSR
jgi:hypothetical protein